MGDLTIAPELRILLDKQEDSRRFDALLPRGRPLHDEELMRSIFPPGRPARFQTTGLGVRRAFHSGE